MKQNINIETWARKDHFNFFNQFEEPFYGVCVRADCTKAYRFAKANNLSFHLYCLYCAMGAAYAVEPFKYRVNNGEVFIYDDLIAGTTVSRDNDTFGFAYFDYNPSLDLFLEGANKAIEQVKARTDLVRSPAENVIRFSSL